MKNLLALLLLAPGLACAQIVLPPAKNGTTGYFTPCFPLFDNTTAVDQTKTGITGSTTNFSIYLQANNEANDTQFTTATNVLTIAAIGTYVAPTSNARVRFGECGIPGFYQIQLHNDHMAKTNATALSILITDTDDTFRDQVLFIDQDVADISDIDTAVAGVAGDVCDQVVESAGGQSITVCETLSLYLAEAFGACVFTAGAPDTWVCEDPSGTEARFTITYGTDAGDRNATDADLTPDQP